MTQVGNFSKRVGVAVCEMCPAGALALLMTGLICCRFFCRALVDARDCIWL